MTAEPAGAKRQTKIGAIVAIAVTAVCACVTMLVLGAAGYTAVAFARDHELYGTAWLVVLSFVVLGVISGLATTYLGRRAAQELRTSR